jgi:Secretion system C-terminal sorting domain
MKKIVLFVVFSITTFCYGYSQSLALADSTGHLANNANVTRQGHNMDDEIACYFFVRNTTSSPIDVMVKKVEFNLVSGSMNTFCWGLCFPPNVYISPTPVTVNALTTDSIDFSGHYNPLSFAGASMIRYVFFVQSNPNDSVCVNVTYDALYVGINNHTVKTILSGAYPNPANSTVNFDYSLNTENEGSVIIRNLLGSVVKKSVLIRAEGKLSIFTGDLPEGIYFYSLDVDGKTMITRKLIVRH